MEKKTRKISVNYLIAFIISFFPFIGDVLLSALWQFCAICAEETVRLSFAQFPMLPFRVWMVASYMLLGSGIILHHRGLPQHLPPAARLARPLHRATLAGIRAHAIKRPAADSKFPSLIISYCKAANHPSSHSI